MRIGPAPPLSMPAKVAPAALRVRRENCSRWDPIASCCSDTLLVLRSSSYRRNEDMALIMVTKKKPPAASKAIRNPVSSSSAIGFTSIGDLAFRYGLTLRALRFYEDKGLIAPARVGNMRLYDARAEEQLKKILRAKHFGYSISEMPAFFASGLDGKSAASRRVLDQRLEELLRERKQLDAVITDLKKLMAQH